MKSRQLFLLLTAFLILFSCSENEDTEVEKQEVELNAVTHEVLLFEFTPDTGNNSSRLQYQIKFTNPNDQNIKGFYKVTTNADGVVSSNIASSRSQCYNISANSDCTVSFDAEDSHNLGMINSIELVSVDYTFDK